MIFRLRAELLAAASDLCRRRNRCRPGFRLWLGRRESAGGTGPSTWNIVGGSCSGTPLAPDAPGFWLNKGIAGSAGPGQGSGSGSAEGGNVAEVGPGPSPWNIVGGTGGGTPLAPDTPGFWFNKDAATGAASGPGSRQASSSALTDISAVQVPGGGPGSGAGTGSGKGFGGGSEGFRWAEWPWQRSRERQRFRSRRRLQPARMEFGGRRQREPPNPANPAAGATPPPEFAAAVRRAAARAPWPSKPA